MTASEFIKAHNGVGVDMDGYYGFQCMDLYNAYQKEVLGITPKGAPCAKDVWTTFDPNVWEKIPNSPTGIPQLGDVVIWGMLPYGHIAIATGVGNTSSFQTLDQNWVSSSNYQTRPAQLITHNYNNVLGWLRPKVQGGNMDEIWKYLNEHRDRLFALEASSAATQKALKDINASLATISKALADMKALEPAQDAKIQKAIDDAQIALNKPVGASKTRVELVKEFFSNLKYGKGELMFLEGKLTYIGIAVFAITFLVKQFKLDSFISSADVQSIVELVAGLIGIGVAIYGRYRAKGQIQVTLEN